MPKHKPSAHIQSFGLEISSPEGNDLKYFGSEEAREKHLRSLGAEHSKTFYLGPRRVRRCVLLTNGGLYTEETAAVHEHWRRTMLHLGHKSRWAYLEQVAMVDLIEGRVVVVDAYEPFKPQQLEQWSKNPCLVEFTPKDRHSHWIQVQPSTDDSWYHYRVLDEDLERLQRSTPQVMGLDQRTISAQFVEPVV
jgi:hypothetical protein